MNLPASQNQPPERLRRALTMLSLILAGEAVFLPAFHLGRYFKSSLMAAYNIDELHLGNLYAVYGICAMACYFLGGPFADRWSVKKLLSFSLIVTALGSLYMATTPSLGGLFILYGFWGVSTILVFWAPLIRATREWANEDAQGAAFGILDAGRGLSSAVIASIAAYAFTVMVAGDAAGDPVREAAAVQKLVLGYAVNCVLAAICVWLFVPNSQPVAVKTEDSGKHNAKQVMDNLIRVLLSPAIWLQAIVIISAYSAFKMLDHFGIYSEDAYGLSRTDSAKLIANISYVRAGAALAAGWIADKLLGVRFTIQLFFGFLIVSFVAFLFITPSPNLVWLMAANMVVSCIGFYALRGIYFALLEESGTPRALTGTAVGVISFIGYTPDIFMGPLTGGLIRNARANGDVLVGYHQIFWILLVLSACGVLAAAALRWFTTRKPRPDK